MTPATSPRSARSRAERRAEQRALTYWQLLIGLSVVLTPLIRGVPVVEHVVVYTGFGVVVGCALSLIAERRDPHRRTHLLPLQWALNFAVIGLLLGVLDAAGVFG